MDGAKDSAKRPPFVHRRISTASFCGENRDGDAAIRVPADFVIQEGAQLAQNCVIGKRLGAGLQGEVYDLVDDQGRPLDLVLKSLPHGTLSHVTGVLASMEREWAVGHRLALHCTTPAGLHPGFMRVGAALIVERAASGCGRFRGMVLEKLNGPTMAHALGKGVQDVHYIRSMLFQVLSALGEAQKLGFRHWDLRLGNIMEHHPAQQRRGAGLTGSSGAAPAAGALPTVGETVQTEQLAGTGAVAAGSAGGSAQAAIELQPRGKDAQLGAAPAAAGSRRWAEDQGVGGAGDCIWKIIDYGHADFGDRGLHDDAVCLDGPRFDAEDGLPRWMLKGMPPLSLPERCYRWFWWRKGDVYRLLMSLQNVIDGCIWPQQDAKLVHALIGLVHHVTGKRLTAHFANNPNGDPSNCAPRFWRRSDGCCHFARRWCVRVQSFAVPYNPGITAAEALAAPFLTRRHWK